ncbi:hypothetical protein ACHIPZ_10405 [Antrihabitans sp. NCIMB 15449]|uniref:Uncharacterized protein n=1 Tax=Antrihabitans spumae TaxID=3373370 RepID=A0ABW7JKT8_9NOCA
MNEAKSNEEFAVLPGFSQVDPFIATQEAILRDLDGRPEKRTTIRELAKVAVEMIGVRRESVVFDAVIELRTRGLVRFEPHTSLVVLDDQKLADL